MDNRESIQPDSLKPQSGNTAPQNGTPPNGSQGGISPDAPVIRSESELADDEGQFLTPGNMIMLGMIIALTLYLLTKFTMEELWAIVKAALGLSFVIFIHELGHFLAAKWCNVNVTTFSIGFGPSIPGCRFRWGETTYKLAILPLGGYVQMVGQVDGDEASDGSEDDPRSYRRKSVSQRMLIISAGVIMNAILAIICFICVYQGPGKEYATANISYVDDGAPAFKHGLRTGAVITKIGNVDNPTFNELMQTVINSRDQEVIPVFYQLPGQKVVETQIEPRLEKSDLKPIIGVVPAAKTQFINKRGGQEGPYYPGSPAADAKFEYGDVIIGMTDPDDPSKVTDLPDDPRYPGHGQRDYFEFARRLQLLADKEIVLRVRRGSESKSREVDVKVAPLFRLDLGAIMQMGPVLAVRENSPAHKPGPNQVRAPNAEKKLKGDLIEAVSVIDDDGKTLEFKDKKLDPERLPAELRRWSDRLDKKGFKGDRPVTLQLRRHRDEGGAEFEQKTVVLKWDKDWRFDRVVPLSPNAGMPIPELGIAYQVNTTVAAVTREDSPLKVGDVIKNIRFTLTGAEEEVPWLREQLQGLGILSAAEIDAELPWMRSSITESQWANTSFRIFQQPHQFKKLEFKVKRDKDEEKVVEIPLIIDRTSPIEDHRGWLLASDTRRVTASNPLNAVRMGLVDTNNRMWEVFQNLYGMITGRLSVWNLGGPLTIAFGTYRFASMDYAEFFFFLGLISINLAVVNFLPIPILDGGHMVFLIYEKVRGQPAPEGVRIIATYIGLGMILCLMFFVLYIDVVRLFFS